MKLSTVKTKEGKHERENSMFGRLWKSKENVLQKYLLKDMKR